MGIVNAVATQKRLRSSWKSSSMFVGAGMPSGKAVSSTALEPTTWRSTACEMRPTTTSRNCDETVDTAVQPAL